MGDSSERKINVIETTYIYYIKQIMFNVKNYKGFLEGVPAFLGKRSSVDLIFLIRTLLLE